MRDAKMFMRKRCPDHGWFEALVSSDAEMYLASLRYNKPGTMPLKFSTEVREGCPEHKQHTCLALIEVNSHCNLDCPICFADAQPGYSLTLAQVKGMLDRFFELEAEPEVVQFSGGEPTIHPEIVPMMALAKGKGIRHVMLNTNGIRLARDRRFLEEVARVKPIVYLQFDGFSEKTYLTIRGKSILKDKLKALDQLAEVGMDAVLVPAIEKGVNDHEIGDIVRFGLEHPAVRGVAFQPVTHSGRNISFDPMDHMTLPDVIHGIADQTEGTFTASDFVAVPCCHPTCRSATYAYVEDGKVTPLPRLLDVEDYMDYITNRTLPDPAMDIRAALEKLWSASAVPGTQETADQFCSTCTIADLMKEDELKSRVFMIVVQGFADPYTLDLTKLMKCCIGVLVPNGRMIPFCAFNSVGYREKVRAQLQGQKGG